MKKQFQTCNNHIKIYRTIIVPKSYNETSCNEPLINMSIYIAKKELSSI